MDNTNCQSLYSRIVAGEAPSRELGAEIAALAPSERSQLAERLASLNRNGEQYPALSFVDSITQLGKPIMTLKASGLQLGDVVRSTDSHWERTQEDITGAIVRFERVSDHEARSVGSDHWVYLNSREEPISLAIIERAPNFGSSLRI